MLSTVHGRQVRSPQLQADFEHHVKREYKDRMHCLVRYHIPGGLVEDEERRSNNPTVRWPTRFFSDGQSQITVEERSVLRGGQRYFDRMLC